MKKLPSPPVQIFELSINPNFEDEIKRPFMYRRPVIFC